MALLSLWQLPERARSRLQSAASEIIQHGRSKASLLSTLEKTGTTSYFGMHSSMNKYTEKWLIVVKWPTLGNKRSKRGRTVFCLIQSVGREDEDKIHLLVNRPETHHTSRLQTTTFIHTISLLQLSVALDSSPFSAPFSPNSSFSSGSCVYILFLPSDPMLPSRQPPLSSVPFSSLSLAVTRSLFSCGTELGHLR